MNNTQLIEKVKISSICYESLPCQHDLVIIYKDGHREEKKYVWSCDIANDYWDYINPEDKEHVAIYRKAPEIVRTIDKPKWWCCLW